MGVLSREKHPLLFKKGRGHIFEGEPIFEVTVLEAIYTLDEI